MTIFSRTGSDTRRQSSYRTEPPFSSFLAGTRLEDLQHRQRSWCFVSWNQIPISWELRPHYTGKEMQRFYYPEIYPLPPCAGSPKAGAAAASQGLHRGGGSENFGVLGSPPNKHIFCICTHTCIACQYSYIRHRGTESERAVPASNASVYTPAAAALVGETPQTP